MNAPSFPPRGARIRDSFTLVEVLVAVAVLCFILVILARMVGMVHRASSDGIGRVDNFTKSRAILDLVASDLEHAVIRPDLPIFQTGGAVLAQGGFTHGAYAAALFVSMPSAAGTASGRDVSLVAYDIVQTNSVDKVILRRSDMAVPWSQGASSLLFQGDLAALTGRLTARDMAPGVIGFQFSFRRADGTISTEYTGYNAANPVVAMGVALAVLDSRALNELAPNVVSQMRGVLTNSSPIAPGGIPGVKALWDASLSPAFYAGYPKDVATGLKTFERWIIPSRPF